MKYTREIGRWDLFEAVIEGPDAGNPFVEQSIHGIFTGAKESVVTEGFYDGEGIYRIRFMPSFEGKYTFIIRTSFDQVAYTGTFYALPAGKDVHGPVRVQDTYHFAYEDGTPFQCVGTTAYVWELQDKQMQEETLKSLEEARFNKLRFCILPKHYVYNFKDPEVFPYVGTPMDASVLTEDNFMEYSGRAVGNHFDYKRFNPEYFRRVERSIYELAKRGIEADLIVMHPYDRWGFSCMDREEDELYWNYVINRFAAFRNVWWSLANEYDLMAAKTVDDWEFFGSLLVRKDPYHHLRSIHNCRLMYDHSRPWITHCCIQRVDLYKGAELTDELRTRFGKPVVMDEIAYEGNIQYGWGNITPEEMVRRFWETAVRGGYPGHGETYLSEDGKLWWSHGGTLKGESWKRFGFLKDIMSEVPGSGIAPLNLEWDSICGVPEKEWFQPVKSQYLFYYSFMRPSFREFHIDDTTDFVAEVIDTWNMTITKAGIFSGKFRVGLPAKQYMAIRLRKAEEKDYLENKAEAADAETALSTTSDSDDAEPVDSTEETIVETAPEENSGEPVVETESFEEDMRSDADASEDTERFNVFDLAPIDDEDEETTEEENLSETLTIPPVRVKKTNPVNE